MAFNGLMMSGATIQSLMHGLNWIVLDIFQLLERAMPLRLSTM